MTPVAPLADSGSGEDGGDIMDVSDAEEDDTDHKESEHMGVEDIKNGEGNYDEDHNEEEDGQKGGKGKEKEKDIITEAANMEEPVAEEALAATRVVTIGAEDASVEHVGSEAIDAEYEQVVYFYGRHDSTQKLYRLPLYQADTWMGLRRYLRPLVSQTGRFRIWGPDDKEIAEVFWKPYPKVGKTFSFIYSELVFVTVISTNSTAVGYSVFPMTITERTLVHELRSLIHWEMRRQRWRAPEKVDALELDAFLVVDRKPCFARMNPRYAVGHYLQGRSEELKVKIRNLEVRKEGEVVWPTWDERMYWN